MKPNMGSTDRAIRVMVAVVVGILIALGVLKGMLAVVAGVLAAVFVLTSTLSFCPLYLPFKLSTCKSR
jgi:uncharacterized membrane protein YkgB